MKPEVHPDTEAQCERAGLVTFARIREKMEKDEHQGPAWLKRWASLSDPPGLYLQRGDIQGGFARYPNVQSEAQHNMLDDLLLSGDQDIRTEIFRLRDELVD
eukprot:1862183-Prymnesium_polylepis.1